ncbi:MAG: D-alanyl-D-alanine carboxypeptidase [Oscillospiraceae bacterium]|nr:D-alanyl-D-alanine carboxypeptidase [Oscillospiraceae bacterium]
MKKLFCALTALALLVCTAAAAPIEVTAPSAILIEQSSGSVLFDKDANVRRRPASVTKVMTLLLVMEALDAGQISWDDTVIASAEAVKKGGSQIYLSEGEAMPLRDMVKAVVVSSANDCACALAEHVAGSESAFVERMNERARELNMTDTHFVNCTGLDDGPAGAEHLTTAADIAIMSRELLKHDEIREFTTIWMDTVRGGEFGLSNTNKLVRFYDGTTGLKTGYTSAAGHCISASAMRDGMELIAVVMAAPSSADRFADAKAMLNYGFANYAVYTPAMEQPTQAVPVVLGTAEAVTPRLDDDTPILMEKAKKNAVSCVTELDESATAPVAEGQPIGTLTVRVGDQTVATRPLVAAFAVPRMTWWQVTARLFSQICLCE